MAQRTLHYLLGELISRQVQLNDKEKFLLGSILPDAAAEFDRNAAHFKVKTDSIVYYDFEAFRTGFHEHMLQDDLYLGYYMHLVEDVLYRKFVYKEPSQIPRNRDTVDLLHRDYHILNSYIVRKYQLHNVLTGKYALEHEPVSDIASFAVDRFLDAFSQDFIEQIPADPVFLTETMVDDYIDTVLPLAIAEIKSVKQGSSVLKPIVLAWPRIQK